MKCPSYTMGCKIKSMPETIVKMFEDLENVNHFEGMFCAFEKSKCIHEDKGCMCESCPVYTKYDLVREEYCLKSGGRMPHTCVSGFDSNAKKS